MAPRRVSFTLNPLWSHYVAGLALALAVVLGLFRFVVLDHSDPIHCGALLSRGRWLDTQHKNWQPDGCMSHNYPSKDISTCIASRNVVFIGDSVTRQLYFQFAHLTDPTLPTAPPDDERKHANHNLTASTGTTLLYFWDPFLNSSYSSQFINPPEKDKNKPALLVLGSGLWYLRYQDSGGLPAWEAKMEAVVNSLSRPNSPVADSVVVLPVEDVVPSKLSKERAASMHASDIDAMNSDLYHRLRPSPHYHSLPFFSHDSYDKSLISLPLVFNQMLDPSQTTDGLHFSDSLVRVQANLLLNLRCNDVLPKVFPLDKTCCRSYPRPSVLHLLVLVTVILWGPASWFLSRRLGNTKSWIPEEQIPALVFSASIALIYLADRTGFWEKEQKQFSPWTFGFLCFMTLVVGLLSVKRADNDLGFLNRDQTDEWKGWMQLAILIYHYFGASKISGIYNPVRVLVASYLFMTGYGHTTFYVKKADFGFLRVAQVMVRLNLYTLLLAYTMNTDYISYYFSPLVSMWYLIIYFTMLVGSQYNDRMLFLLFKIVLSMGAMTWFMSESWLLEALFGFLARVCNIHWSAREWAFRVNLDLWIVYLGMLTALLVIKIRELRLTDHPHWPLVHRGAIGASGLVLLWFFAFELSQPDKFIYNTWHPYISFLPIAAFIVLRNANAILRSASSRAFAFIGTCSLETFIIQYHFWLAGDTKGILLIVPGTRWRPVNMALTTFLFIYVSHRVAQATGQITQWICDTPRPPTLPTVTDSSPSRLPPPEPELEEGQEVIFLTPQENLPLRKDNEGNVLPHEPDTPIRPLRRWVDRLADGPSSSPPAPGFRVIYGETEWKPGVKVKIFIGLGVMWLLNMMWSNP